MDNRTLGRAVDTLLTSRHQSREELAKVLGLSTKTVGRRMRGDMPWLASEVADIAEHFGVPVGDLFSGRVTIDFAATAEGGGYPRTTGQYLADMHAAGDIFVAA